MNTLQTDSEIREEFINNEELAGAHGYCNPVMAAKIADFWLSKLAEYRTTLLEEFSQSIVNESVKIMIRKYDGETEIENAFNEGVVATLDKVKDLLEKNKKLLISSHLGGDNEIQK